MNKVQVTQTDTERYTMKIKITKYSDSRFWYAKYVGEVFWVRRIDTDRYWCREQNETGYLNFVLFEDCIEYKEIE